MARIAALTVILLSGALSTIWVFRVPIFQAPDEPAHFDYAISLASAGRLIGLGDGKPAWIVSPYTKYLMRASDFDRIVWRTSMHVAPDYGTRAYFARADAAAPNVRSYESPKGRISYITALYPFGFYGLEAIWMRTVAALTGSLTAVFFSARILCVLLTTIGLYFNYRTAINLGVPRWTSVALTGAIGFFPLTSFVASYVQPDNLSYALVSAALFFTTELGRRARLSIVTVLGLVLGLLAVTKVQFFLSAALPIALFVLVRLKRLATNLRQRVLLFSLLLAPSVILRVVQHSMVDRAGAALGAAAPTTVNLEYFRNVMTGGFAATLGYAASETLRALTDFLITGGSAATFWQTIGWVDTPIVIVNPGVEFWLRAAIGLIGLAVLVTICVRLARNGVALLALSWRGYARSAMRIATADPVLNSYLCFAALMLVLYVLSHNVFGAEGRHWYPYIFPTMLCFVWYAPRALRKRHLRMSAALACVLLAYSLVAAGYALADLNARYYGPQTARYVTTLPEPSRVSADPDGILWPILSADYHVSDGSPQFAYVRGSRLLADGSALMLGLKTVPSTVAVVVDSRMPMPVLANQYLYPIAEATHSLASGYSGFYAPIDTTNLSEGAHSVRAYALIPNQQRYAIVPPTRLFFITGDAGRFSHATLRQLLTARSVPGSLRNDGKCRGDVALVAGRLARPSPRVSAIWILAQDRPFPARYRRSDGSFTATIPSSGLSGGVARITAFAMLSDSLNSLRIAQSAVLAINESDREAHVLPQRPAECDDPLAEMAQ
ncbi:MAG: DUF2142 domain-containing protein [Candidatus Eremiobacteraeota bacterium]|nr:DUF2142 domain-containing protein [Candidatus Eremiobacteraeota bacterium]